MESVSDILVQEFYSNVTTDKIEPNIQSIEPSIDKNKHLSMQGCKTCAKSFGKHSSKKYHCHFCYEAFCSDCCVIVMKHPETGKNERTCGVCFLRYTKDNVIDVSEEFVQIKLKMQIEERKKEQDLREKIIREIEVTRQKIKENEEKARNRIDELNKDIREEDLKIKAKETSTKLMRDKLRGGHTETGANRSTPSEKEGCMKCEIF